jgi:hypothetical protein
LVEIGRGVGEIDAAVELIQIEPAGNVVGAKLLGHALAIGVGSTNPLAWLQLWAHGCGGHVRHSSGSWSADTESLIRRKLAVVTRGEALRVVNQA